MIRHRRYLISLFGDSAQALLTPGLVLFNTELTVGEAVVSAVRLEVVPVTVLEVVELLPNDVGKQLPHNAVRHRFLTCAARE